MVWEQLVLWQKIVLYAFVLLGLLIFVKTSKLQVQGRPLIPLKYRIPLALFFPVIAALLFFFGIIIVGVAVLALAGFLGYALLTKKRFKLPGVKIIVRRGLPK